MTRTLLLATTMLLLAPLEACKSSVPPGSAGARSATAMGDWGSWRVLGPLVEVAESHAPEPALLALREASALLAQGKARSADRRLAEAASAAGRRWIAVARGDLAALHFTVCIRGIAWRLSDETVPSATDRAIDFSPDTRVEAGDVSVEALLNNLDEAMTADDPVLATQARIARARVGAFAQRCAANDDVEALARRSVEADLATLAAEGHLTPDLAYLWAGVQMTRFSGSAARPFLLQAREGGFDHPAVTLMLALIALEERDLGPAETLAAEATKIYETLGDDEEIAQAWFVRGQVAAATKDAALAQKHYRTALAKSPAHVPAMLALAMATLAQEGDIEAANTLHAMLPALWREGPLDERAAREVAENLEELAILAEDPAVVQLTRDALLQRIDDDGDAMRRGLRYFFAATLEARLQEYRLAHGHGVLAKEEFAASEVKPPLDVEAFLERLRP